MPLATEGGPSWRTPLTLAAGGLLLVHMLLKYGPALRGSQWPQNGGIDAIALGLAVSTHIPWIAHFLSGNLPSVIQSAAPAERHRLA